MLSKPKFKGKQSIVGRLFGALLTADENRAVEDNVVSSQSDIRSQDSTDHVSQPLTSFATNLRVRIEPASRQTKVQSLLQAREINQPVFTIGRWVGIVRDTSEAIDLSIRQLEPYTVSHRHCALELSESQLTVRDLGGRYGLLIDGQRIGGKPGAPKSIVLGPGIFELVLGPRNSTMRFKIIVE